MDASEWLWLPFVPLTILSLAVLVRAFRDAPKEGHDEEPGEVELRLWQRPWPWIVPHEEDRKEKTDVDAAKPQ